MALECDGSTRSATTGGHVDRSPATSPTATHFPAAGRGASVRRVVAGAGAGRYKLPAVVADVAQLVAHHLAKVRVAGSSPVVRSSSPVARRRRYGIFCARITPPGHRSAARVRTAGRSPAAVAFELFADDGGHDGHPGGLVDDLFAVLVVLDLQHLVRTSHVVGTRYARDFEAQHSHQRVSSCDMPLTFISPTV